MEIAIDGDFILTAILVILQVATVVGVAITKFNDLAHLEEDVKSLDKEVSSSLVKLETSFKHNHKENTKKIDEIINMASDFNAAIKAREVICEERHSNKK